MKLSRIILPILLLGLAALSWMSVLSDVAGKQLAYNECMENAEKSIDDGLYEQAVEYYKQAYEYKNEESIYLSIKETYDLYYEEETTSHVRNLYLTDMASAASLYPENEVFWLAQVNLYLDTESYSDAYSVARKAVLRGVESDELKEIYTTLGNMVTVGYRLYYDFRMTLNGYINVYDGNNWYVMDETGDSLTDDYELIGLINSDGKGLYLFDEETRLLDKSEIARARLDFLMEDAGCYSEESDLVAVKIDGVWRYVDSDGEFLPGSYEIAGAFEDGKAAAYTGEKWVLVDESGDEESLDFEDIVLDLAGNYIQGGVILAKEDGVYHLYDKNFKQIGDFAADEIDICMDEDSYIAYKEGDLWGFTDTEGNVVIEPAYADARSFANGYAAVCDSEGLWGFIDEENSLIVEYTYKDAYYFTKELTCMVCITEETWQMLSFLFK